MSFGRQPPPNPIPARRNLRADPLVVADGLGQPGHVGPGRLTDLGHRVDERDLGRQEAVGRDLHELRGGVVHDQERRAPLDHRCVDLTHDDLVAAGWLAGARGVGHADHDAVGGQRVGDGEPLAQELRVPDQVDVRTRRCQGLEALPDVPRRPDRHRGLADHRARAGQEGCQGADRGVDLAQVGGVGPRVLRGADPDEVQVPEVSCLGEVGGEPQPPGGDVRREELGQPRLVERDLAAGQGGDLLGVDVDPEDVVAGLGHRRGVGGTEVAGADDGDPQGLAHAARLGVSGLGGRARRAPASVPVEVLTIPTPRSA